MVRDPDEALRKLRGDAEKDDAGEVEDLPPITTLKVDVRDGRGKRYQGTFVFKVPTLGDQVMMGALKAQYLPAGAGGDFNAITLAEQICYLTVTLQRSEQQPFPAWWKPMALYDATPVSNLYAQAVAYEKRFHGVSPIKAADGKSSEGGSDKQEGPGVEGEPDVGRKVQPPAERSETLVSHTSRGS